MRNDQAAIEVRNLKKSFKTVEVLKGVSFTVEKGAIFALLGANGAGKTTTINILTTLMKSGEGEMHVAGYDCTTQAAEVRKRISLTGQFAAVDDILTGRENLELIGDLRHIKNPGTTASRLLEEFGLTEAADRRVGTYSGGMRRRLDIAMSLIGDPSIIFLDEPTTGLDPQSRNAMWQTIRSLASGGTTVFLTTQYLEEADQLADKIAILNDGRIVAEGTATELKKLLPGGQIMLQFHAKEELRAAKALLKSHKTAADDAALSLTVTTDGSVAGLTRLLTMLEQANIDVAEFAQKAPTLDDVFLTVINANKEKK